MSRLTNVVILSRDVARTVKFFNAGLQLPIVFASPTMTELDAGSGFPLIVRGTETCVAPPLLQAARSRAPLTTTTPLSLLSAAQRGGGIDGLQSVRFIRRR